MNFAARLLQEGAHEAPVLVSGEQRLTYADLRHAVAMQAGALRELPPNSRVAVLADPGPFFVTAYLGVMVAGHCVVPLPIGQSEEAWKGFLEHVEPAGILSSERWREEAASLAPALPTTGRPDPVAKTGELAALMFTSGSTGRPRAVMVTHENLLANTQDIVSYLNLTSADRVLAALPFSYCYGASLLHTHLWVGASLVTEGLTFYEKTLDTMQREECTGLAGVPSTYQILLRKSTFLKREWPHLRWLQQAGGKLADPYLRELKAGLPHTRIFVMYGQTEATARLSYLPPELLDTKLGSIGKGLPSTRLRLHEGEIVASGPNISPGYWRDPEATARIFRGELYTGDLARADSDGFLYIEGRERHFIKSAGHRISPDEVETALAAHPGVVECAVIGVPDELLGEAVKAFVVGPATPEELLLHCRKSLPNALVPTRWQTLDTLPRGPAGKVLKEALRGL